MPAPTQNIRHVVFDLGGVLVDFRGISSLAQRLGEDPATMAKRWLSSPAVRAYERGQTTTEALIAAIRLELNGTLSSEELRTEMASWLPGLLPGARALLVDLQAADAPHSCLSNTNALHWKQMRSWGIDRTFERTFLSHELAVVKPDAEIFDAVASGLKLAPAQILFLDDHPDNVAAARASGFRSEQVDGPASCRATLARYGVLRPT